MANHTKEHMDKMAKKSIKVRNKYKKEYPEMLYDLIDKTPTTEYISQVDLCRRFNIRKRDTLIAWRKKYPEFDEAMEFFTQWQESLFIKNSLYGNWKESSSQFFLRNNFGYNDKQTVVSTTMSYEELLKQSKK